MSKVSVIILKFEDKSMSSERVESILWDVGAVLFSEAQISRSEFEPVRKLLGISADVADQIFDRFWKERVRIGKMTEEEFWNEYLKVSAHKPSVGKIRDLYRDCIVPNNELLAIVRLLSGSHNQYIVSNHGREWMQYLVLHWRLNEIFRGIYCSAWMGVGKPDREFYEMVLRDSGVNPQRTLYIDDNLDNLHVASSLGIQTLIFLNNKDIVNKLKEKKVWDL